MDVKILLFIYLFIFLELSLNNTFPLLLCFRAGMHSAWACVIVALSLCHGKGLSTLSVLFLVFTYTLLLGIDIKEEYGYRL